MTVLAFTNQLKKCTFRNGRYQACCPAHDDQHPSLTVTEGEKGEILVKCHAGCTTEEIVSAMGMTMADLFPAPVTQQNYEIIYPYYDADGNLIAQKVRTPTAPKGKWRRPDGKGGWIHNRNGVPTTLYVAGSLKGDAIVIAEGEKDCDSVHNAFGFDAVSGMDGAGAGKWKSEYTKQLTGKTICIFMDNDDPGRAYGEETANALYGHAKSVQLLDLRDVWPEIPEKGDISDLIAHFGDEKALEMVINLMSNTPAWQPTKQCAKKEITNDDTPRIKAISAAELMKREYPEARFLVDGILPMGTTLLSAASKIGKSWMMLDLAMCIATEEPFLGHNTHEGRVLYLAFEDTEPRMQARLMRLLRNDAVPQRLDIQVDIITLNDGLIQALEEYLLTHSDVKVVIIDTFQKVRGTAKHGETSYMHDYREMSMLKKFGDQHGVAIIIVHHNRKSKDDCDAFNMISGTTGIMGSADTSWVITKEKRGSDEATLHITGRDVTAEEIIIRFDKNDCRWHLLGDAAAVSEQNIRDQYERDPIVQAIKKFLPGCQDGMWRGTASELMAELSGIAGYAIESTPKKFAQRLRELDAQLRKYDGIIHDTTSHGTAGATHHLRYAMPKWVADAEQCHDIQPL